MKRSRGDKHPRTGSGTRVAHEQRLVIVAQTITDAGSLTELTVIVQTLFEREGGGTYPWQETPDEIVEAMRSYLASGQSDTGALSRVPALCSLRSRLEELYPPLR